MDHDAVPVGAVLDIAWGEPVQECTVVVHHCTEDGMVVSLVNDHTQLDGYGWCSRHAISSIEPLPDDGPTLRHLRAVGIVRDAAQLEHDTVTSILKALRETGVLLFFQDVEDGSDAGSVGRVLRIDSGTVVFSDIGVDGRDTGDELRREVSDLTHISWDDTYSRALTVLNGLDDADAARS